MKRVLLLAILTALAVPFSLAAEQWIDSSSLMVSAQSSEDDDDDEDDDEDPVDPDPNFPSILPDPWGYTGDAADCVVSCGVEVDRCTAVCDADDDACRRGCMNRFSACRRGCRNVGYGSTCIGVSIGHIIVLVCSGG